MGVVKSKRGITLVALAVTIVVLLMLAGVALVILNNTIMDKAILASSKTTESSLEEMVQMAWIDTEASYWNEVKENSNLVKQDYFNEKFLENLQNLEDVKNVTITGNVDEALTITFKYKRQKYMFTISKNGKVENICQLKGNVKVGDYIEYPIEYDDVWSKQHYTATTGWRVIDDGKMKGTSGEVRIISTGVPAKWDWTHGTSEFSNNKDAVHNLVHNFENLNLINDENGNSINGKYFKDESMATKVTTISLSDFNYTYNEIHGANRKSDDTSDCAEDDDLLFIEDPQVYYWLATSNIDNDEMIYYILNGKIKEDSDLRAGIRPVICLKDNLTGTISSGVWKIMK